MDILDIFSNAFYIIVAVLVLLFMITVHEFGHYVAGKILKFHDEVAASGPGPNYSRVNPNSAGEIFSLRVYTAGPASALSRGK